MADWLSPQEREEFRAYNEKRYKEQHGACLEQIAQLRGNLSLAEEGLANYAQENERLKAALEWCEGEAEKGEATCWHCSQVAWKTAEVLPESPEPQTPPQSGS